MLTSAAQPCSCIAITFVLTPLPTALCFVLFWHPFAMSCLNWIVGFPRQKIKHSAWLWYYKNNNSNCSFIPVIKTSVHRVRYWKHVLQIDWRNCRRNWNIWSPADVLSVWPAQQHPVSFGMYISGRGAVWSFWVGCQNNPSVFWSSFKRVRKEKDIYQQLNCT